MTSCTQPGCTGTILDGYCDVCGSPAGAPVFALAEASTSAGLPTAAGEPRQTAVRRGAEVFPEPKNAGLNTACTQPGCTGRSSTLTAMSAAVPPAQHRSFHQLLRRHPSLSTSLV